MTTTVQLDTDGTYDGTIDVYLAEPPQGAAVKGGLIVIHEIWGLVPQIIDVADRFAAEGLDIAVSPLHVAPADLAAFQTGHYPMPPWVGRDDVHRSHRSKLLAKAPEFYRDVFPDDEGGLDYVWPGESEAAH